MGYWHLQLGFRAQIGFELVQGGTGDDGVCSGRIAIQLTLSAARRLAQAVRLLDDAERQRCAQEHQFIADDCRSGRHPLVLQRDPRGHQGRLCLRLFGHFVIQVKDCLIICTRIFFQPNNHWRLFARPSVCDTYTRCPLSTILRNLIKCIIMIIYNNNDIQYNKS